jgi:hypothetical protein
VLADVCICGILTIDLCFSVPKDPNCPHLKIIYSPNGANMTRVLCDYPGDTVTCQHCNGTNKTYVCAKCRDFQPISCNIHEHYVSRSNCPVVHNQTCNYTQTREARDLFNWYFKNLTCKPCLRSLYRTSTQGIPRNLSAGPNLNPSNFTTMKLLCLLQVTYSLE